MNLDITIKNLQRNRMNVLIAENKELNKIAEKYPSNLEICKDILNMLDNKNVKIEINK